jgi:WD40 repeat protein
MAEPQPWRSRMPLPETWEIPDETQVSQRYWALWRAGKEPDAADFLTRAGVTDPEQIVAVLRVDQSERASRGQWVPAETYLEAFPAVRADTELAIDLVFAEYLLREQRVEPPEAQEFLGRFPEYADELKLQFELHQAMEAEREPDGGWSLTPSTPTMAPDADPALNCALYPRVPGHELLGVLGRGGMGVVYRAWQTQLKRFVAIKMVHAGALASPQILARFQIEAEAVARLRHPNIVQIYDVGQYAGAPFLLLELVDGPSLAQDLAGSPQPVRRAAELGETLARAIHSAHLLGVIHRDLTPANILMAAGLTPKITDFGLAKLVQGGGSMRTQTGDLLGTPSYMAPEQAGGVHREIGPATDVYALGAILYEMLTGRPPFKAEMPTETLRQVLCDDPVYPSRLRPRLPADLETICLKCLRKEPAARYPGALALAGDLRRFLDGQPVLARRTTAAERFVRWCTRNRGLAAASIAAAALTVLLAIGATVAAFIFRHQRDQMNLDRLRVRDANRQTRESLFNALTAQARARRSSRQVGQRFESLRALAAAAQIARELDLPGPRLEPIRDEAIACFALPDLLPTGRVIEEPQGTIMTCFDSMMMRYAVRLRTGTIVVRNIADDSEVARFIAQGDRHIFTFNFSPDGRYLATTHFPGYALSVWNVESKTLVMAEPGPVAGTSARFSPDSRRMVVAHFDGDVLAYDLESAAVSRFPRGRGRPQDLAIRPDGNQIAITSSDATHTECRILEAQTGRLVRAIVLPAASSVAWSPDGLTLATSASDSTINLWEASSGSSKVRLEGSANGGIHAVFHPAGALIASRGWENRLRFWDLVSGRPVLNIYAVESGRELGFSRDGRTVVSADKRMTTLQVDPALEYRALVRGSADPMQYHESSMRHDGRLLAVGAKTGVVLWDLARGTECGFLPIGFAWHVLFEDSGDLLTSEALGLRRWPVELDAERGVFRLGPPAQILASTSHGGFSEDRSGRTVALADTTGAALGIAGQWSRVGPLDECRFVALSPDGKWLATGSHHVGAQVWNIRDKAKVAELAIDDRTDVAFSPDGRWLMTKTSPCKLWNSETWTLARELGETGLCFSADSRLIAAVNASRVVLIVEAESGRIIARLESPDSPDVGSATFSPDGSRLVLVSENSPAVRVWDLRAVRRGLVDLGLDWAAPALSGRDPASATARPLPPLAISR